MLLTIYGLFCADVPLRNYSLTHAIGDCVEHSTPGKDIG